MIHLGNGLGGELPITIPAKIAHSKAAGERRMDQKERLWGTDSHRDESESAASSDADTDAEDDGDVEWGDSKPEEDDDIDEDDDVFE